MLEIIPTFLGLEEVADIADGAPEGVIGSRLGLSQERFELGEGLLDRIEIGRVFRQEQEPGAALGQGLCRTRTFMDAQIVSCLLYTSPSPRD